MKKKIIRAANRIANLESQLALGKDVQKIEEKIQNIADSLSLEEMLEIDEYIMNKKLLKSDEHI